jgi:hypothetical protein
MADPLPEGSPPVAEASSNADQRRTQRTWSEQTRTEQTRAERTSTDGTDDAATGPIAPRWTGAAPIPPPSPRRRWWRFRARPAGPRPLRARPPTTRPAAVLDPTRAEITRREPGPLNPTATLPDPDDVVAALAGAPRPVSDPQREWSYQDWEFSPPVDPWADQDTVWNPFPGTPMPPAEPPATVFPLSPRATPPAPAATVPGRPAQAAKESRQARNRRLRTGELPPPWSPPTPDPPAPPRRRRRRRKPLAVLALLGIGAGLWYGGPALGVPYVGQYPVTAHLPYVIGDLRLRDDSTSSRTLDNLVRRLRDAGAPGDAFAGVYGDGAGKRVTVFGTTGFRWAPQHAIETEMLRLTDEFGLREVEVFDLGESGAHERCGVGRANGASVVVCSWADHGSLASVLLTRRSAAESADLVGRLRGAVLNRP